MTDTKSILKSRSIWGSIIALAGGLGKVFGWNIPTDEINNALDWVLANWDTFAVVFGPIIAAVFRAKATKQIVLK